MKKLFLCLLLVGGLTLVGCSTPEEKTESSSEAGGDNPLAGLSEKDVVSEEIEEIGGEKMAVKTLKDGTTITLPEGMTIEEAQKQYESGNADLHAEEATKE